MIPGHTHLAWLTSVGRPLAPSRWAIPCLTISWIAACTTVPPPESHDGLLADATTQSIGIGTWNLEFLGAPGDFRNHLPVRDEADFHKVGEKIRSLGVAVLAVQEICGEAPLRKVAAGAGPSWDVVLGTTGGWDDGKTAQNIGFLYDRNQVELLHAEELLNFPRTLESVPIFHRVPVTACFRVVATGFDFRAVTVHLKAGQKAQDEQKRRLESATLHDWVVGLQHAAGEDQDLVVLGDFNSTYGTEPQQNLEMGGSLQYLHPSSPTPTIMHFPEPIDQVVRGPGFGELRADSFTVHGDFGGLDKDAWRKIYSDHFPVTVEVVAASDTDPNATFAHGEPQFVLPASRRPAAGPWPLRIGSMVTVTWGTTASAKRTGRLLTELPAGPGGWLAIEVDGGLLAIPFPQIVDVVAK